MQKRIDEAAAFLQMKIPRPLPAAAVVLGSGLGELADEAECATVLPMTQAPHWPVPTVPGHPGRIVAGTFDGIPLLLLQGRVHFYEGFSIQDVVFSIRVLGRLGIRRMILTNAAGGIRATFRPGDLMLIADHINLMGTNPLIGPHEPGLGTRFPDMTTVYDAEYISIAKKTARGLNLVLRKGVLAAMSGPSYETAAEIRMLRKLGADAVSMSTVPEAIAAAQMGMRVMGISFISNYATGVRPRRLSHAEVEETARRYRGRFKALVKSAAVRIAAQP